MPPSTRRTTRSSSRPGPFLGWDRLQGDELQLVLCSLVNIVKPKDVLTSLIRASRVSIAWAAAARADDLWKEVVQRLFPQSKHAAIYASFNMLGAAEWKSRCRLMIQRTKCKLTPEQDSHAKLSSEYSFVVSVSDGCGGGASATARLCKDKFAKYEFILEANFASPAAINAGVKEDEDDTGWLVQDNVEAEFATGFGKPTVDVFVRRVVDGKSAHLFQLDFDFEDPFPSEGVNVYSVEDKNVVVVCDKWDLDPPWLSEHVNDVYPNLALWRDKGRLQWPHHRNGTYAPTWRAELRATMQTPKAEDVMEGDCAVTGKWTAVQVAFEWQNPDNVCGNEDPVQNSFMVQALAGRAFSWV